MTSIIRTFPAPAFLAARPDACVTEYADGRWVCHPADYDAAVIDEDDVREDAALRHLTLDEIERMSTLVADTARACAQGWAEQAHDDSARTWTESVPAADLTYLAMEILRRDPTADETSEFDGTFRDEYAACMAQRTGE